MRDRKTIREFVIPIIGDFYILEDFSVWRNGSCFGRCKSEIEALNKIKRRVAELREQIERAAIVRLKNLAALEAKDIKEFEIKTSLTA